jgi:micrococcal nuclease
MGEPSAGRGLASVTLEELRARRRTLQAGAQQYWARLEAIEARKGELDVQGAARHSLAAQQRLAQQVTDLDREAEQQARLLRLVGKQQELLDRLIVAREDAAQWKALREAAPSAMLLGWSELVEAASAATGADDVGIPLSDRLRALGVPAEEWPKGAMASASPASTDSRQNSDLPVRVAAVLDGRTVRLTTGETVRYIGVVTPELHNPPGQPEPGAVDAREANRRLVEDRTVRLEVDRADHDLEGVLWRYVWAGKTCVNAELIRQGRGYTAYTPPNSRHYHWFSRLEDQARSKKRGMWK